MEIQRAFVEMGRALGCCEASERTPDSAERGREVVKCQRETGGREGRKVERAAAASRAKVARGTRSFSGHIPFAHVSFLERKIHERKI